MKRPPLFLPGVLSIIVPTVFLAGCKPPQSAGGAPPGFVVPVVVHEVKPEPIERRLDVVGNILAGQEVEIAARVDGFVEEVLFSEGQFVKQGQELFRLDSERYSAAVDQAEAALSLARAEYERKKSLRDSRAISQQEFDQAQAALREAEAALRIARENLSDSVIRAPFDGFTAEHRVDAGQYVNRGQVLTSLVDRSTLRVEFRVPERYIAQLGTGKEVTLFTQAYPDKSFAGKVYFISPRVEESSRTVLLRASLQNEGELLKPGMFVNVQVVTSVEPEALLIPESALMFRGREVSVFAVVGSENGPVVEPRQVRTGQRLAGKVEIIDGLLAGDLVIAEGIQKVGPGSRVQPIEKKAQTSSEKESGA